MGGGASASQETGCPAASGASSSTAQARFAASSRSTTVSSTGSPSSTLPSRGGTSSDPDVSPVLVHSRVCSAAGRPGRRPAGRTSARMPNVSRTTTLSTLTHEPTGTSIGTLDQSPP